jgi:hypothetical protein
VRLKPAMMFRFSIATWAPTLTISRPLLAVSFKALGMTLYAQEIFGSRLVGMILAVRESGTPS